MINRRVLTIAVVAGVLLVLASVDTASAESHEPQQWPAPQSANGYVVFEYTTLANLPGAHVPKPGDVLKKVSCALAADEYESVQFGVHALSGDIKDIQVKVTTDLQVTVYHRISPDVREQLITEPSEIRWWMDTAILLQRGSEFAELPAGQSVNFWLTFGADDQTRPGVHRGKIEIKPAGKAATVIDLDLTVRPFRLGAPRAAFGMWHDEKRMPKRLGGTSMPDEAVLAIYRDMAAHGQHSACFYPPDRSLKTLLPLAKQAGFFDPHVPCIVYAGATSGELSDEQRRAKVAWWQAQSQEHGWPEMLDYGWDEPPYPARSDEVRRRMTRLRGLPMRVSSALSGNAAYGYGDIYDVPIVIGGQISPAMLAEAKRTGAQVWTYSFRLWREGNLPLRQRHYAGLYTWANRLGGNYQWVYGDRGNHGFVWFMPASLEPMPRTGWEARREGIDDYRYLQMVEDCVAANPTKAPAIEAAAWLAALRARMASVDPHEVEEGDPLAFEEYDQIRDRAASYIEQLGPVPNEAVTRSPIPHVKDEARSFRGKSVAQCITGLSSADVSARRSAAWALYEMGPQAAPAATVLAQSLDDPQVRMPALRALEGIGPEAYTAVPKITELFGQSDLYVNLGALNALAAIGCPYDHAAGRRSPSPYAAIIAHPLTAAFQYRLPVHRYLDQGGLPLIMSLAADILADMGPYAQPAVPYVVALLDDPRENRQRLALRLITALGPHAAQAVAKLIEMNEKEPWNIEQLNALAAIGPAASPAVAALEKYAEKKDAAEKAVGEKDAGRQQASTYYALFSIDGDVAQLRKMVGLLEDSQANEATMGHVVKLLNRLGPRAKPVSDEVRSMLESGKYSKWTKDLEAFLEQANN